MPRRACPTGLRGIWAARRLSSSAPGDARLGAPLPSPGGLSAGVGAAGTPCAHLSGSVCPTSCPTMTMGGRGTSARGCVAPQQPRGGPSPAAASPCLCPQCLRLLGSAPAGGAGAGARENNPCLPEGHVWRSRGRPLGHFHPRSGCLQAESTRDVR